MTVAKTESRRYYYTSQKSFEQSLDVYKPVENVLHSCCEEELPLVVLVVGSAWLGHRSIIYTGTSWWNSSGPKAFAQQGCVTVCIRHRGSFPRLAAADGGPLLLMLMMVVPIVMALVVLAATLYKYPTWQWQDDATRLVMSIVAVIVGWALLAVGARGAADFDEMLHDVADALCWVQRHKDTELLRNNNTSSRSSHSMMEEKKDTEQESSSQPLLVFGGYSSGGHVAATLMQRPDLFTKKGLPAPDEFCDAALFISGVLAVRPPPITPSTDVSRSNGSYSTWCTDLVTTVVFGKTGAAKLPSPLYGIHKQPTVPHLLIGCENEVFGLGWMDVFFCSRDFVDLLKRRKVPAKLVQVPSNHWSILSSSSFTSALSQELEWIMTKH